MKAKKRSRLIRHPPTKEEPPATRKGKQQVTRQPPQHSKKEQNEKFCEKVPRYHSSKDSDDNVSTNFDTGTHLLDVLPTVAQVLAAGQPPVPMHFHFANISNWAIAAKAKQKEMTKGKLNE